MEDSRISDVYHKIKREKQLIDAARAMRTSTDNPVVQQQLDSNIRESQKNISYLEGRLLELQNRQMQALSLGPLSGGGPPLPPKNDSQRQGDNDMSDPRPPFAQQTGLGMPKSRPHYSKLDLIKYDTPHLGPRITLMLSQLEFKLSVEKQYKEGIEKMARLYQMEGDRRSRADADAKRIESNQKIQLLKQALKRYEDLHVDMDDEDIQPDDDSINTPNTRRPLTGHLNIKIFAVKDVNHATTSRFARGPESFVVVKVEDLVRAKTRPTRNDKWVDEYHDIDVDKANEMEITVYDKPGEHPLPVGMLWIRISDIVEELRRKKIEQDISSAGWVSAGNMEKVGPGRNDSFSAPLHQQGSYPQPDAPVGKPPGGVDAPHQEAKDVNVEAWFALEPVGQIHLQLNFVKHNKNIGTFDVGLGRKGAVRKQKEEIHEMYGHKFVQQQFYNIMRCAYCGDFLKYSAGYQCSDCKYTCHKKCYQGVVTKCISKSNAESDPDEAKLNHRIPHRFVATTNLGANWCCHCGYMLPVGKKNARKCTECQLTCHAHCAHLVPDFCGMSMEKANEIIKTIKSSRSTQGRTPYSSTGSGSTGKKHNLEKSLRTPSGQHSPSSQSPSRPTSESTLSFGPSSPIEKRTSMVSDYYTTPSANIPPPPPPPPQQTPYQAPTPALDSQNAAKRAYNPQAFLPGPPPTPPPNNNIPPQQRPANNRNLSSAAAAIAMGGAPPPAAQRPQSVTSPSYQSQQQSYNSTPSGRPDYNQQYSAPPPNTSQSSVSQYQDAGASSRPMSTGYGQTPPPPPNPQSAGYNPQPATQKMPPAINTQSQAMVPSQSKQGQNVKIGLDNFNFLAVLGKGNFGKVMLAETKKSKQLYAIKVLKKEFIIENDEVESTKSEKRVFLIANKERHPFLLNLHACFQTETRVYFVMEYISGGDLMLHIQRGQFGTKRAQFYAAEVCLALKYFHENKVIYRDLKLDNILLTLDGHIKIADYGLCKEGMGEGATTSTFCGTPEFMAPEILMDKRYGRAVDWWAFGVLIYQMLLQQSPFRGEDEDEIYDAILSDEPLYPIHMPRDSVSILQKLLTREPELRLGSGPGDAQEIMSHAFFRNVNWDDIYHKRVPTPYQPQITSATDTSNFDSEFTSVTPVLTPVQSVLTQAMQEEFRGFSYTADFV